MRKNRIEIAHSFAVSKRYNSEDLDWIVEIITIKI